MISRYRRWKRNSEAVTIERFRSYLDLVIEKARQYEMGQLSKSNFRPIVTEYREISDWLDRVKISDDPYACYQKVNELIDNSIFAGEK